MKELSFKTNARHIGQLGRELVTDFVTALVELIKNSYDADAQGAEIIISKAKTPEGKIVIADCGEGMTIEDFENKWMVIGTSNKLSTPYTASGRKKAGKKGIGRFSVERLAEKVTIYSFPKTGQPFYVQIDWNKFEEIDISALEQRIAVLKKRNDREAAKFVSSQIQYLMSLSTLLSEDRAIILNEWGTQYTNYELFFESNNLNILESIVLPILRKYEGTHQLIEDIKSPLILLDDYKDCSQYKLIESIRQKSTTCKTDVVNSNYYSGKTIETSHSSNESFPSDSTRSEVSGLVMELEGLRDEWSQKDIDKLAKELRLLVAPNLLESQPFFIELKAPEFIVEESVPVNSIIDASFAMLTASISDNGKKSNIKYADKNGVQKELSNTYETPLLCGDLTFELYYFLRDSEHLQLSGYNYRFAIRILDTYCGIKIYRDMFRVKPYGDSGNDWLFLDKEKVRDTHGYLVGNNQTIGRINISDKNNPLLVDATNREGIIENAAFDQMRTFIKECISLISEVRKEEYEKKEVEKRSLDKEHERIQSTKGDVIQKQSEMESALKDLNIRSQSASYVATASTVQNLLSKVEQYHKAQQEYQKEYESNAERRYQIVQEVLDFKVSELEMYKNLATLGMLASEFGHETSDIVNRIRNSVQAVIRDIRNNPQYETSVEILNIVKDDFRRIYSYSNMIIAFLRKKKREAATPLAVSSVVKEICGYYEDILSEFNIEIIDECEQDVIVTMRQIDLESIVINMITNAYAQLKTCKTRKIMIRAWKENNIVKMCFEDSGPGVPEKERENIFKAFVSTKEDGIGLGLNIVQDIVTSYKGTIKCKESTILGGACFVVCFTEGDEPNEA